VCEQSPTQRSLCCSPRQLNQKPFVPLQNLKARLQPMEAAARPTAANRKAGNTQTALSRLQTSSPALLVRLLLFLFHKQGTGSHCTPLIAAATRRAHGGNDFTPARRQVVPCNSPSNSSVAAGRCNHHTHTHWQSTAANYSYTAPLQAISGA